MVQTFADGTTEEWSDLVPYSGPAPAHPALVVPYGASAPLPPGPAHHHGHDAADAADVAVTPATVGAGVRLAALAGVGLALVAAGSAALGRRQRRRLETLHRAATGE